MADLILPIVVSVVAVLVALGAQQAWGAQRGGRGRPNVRIAGLGSRWAKKLRVAGMRAEAPATPVRIEGPAADAVPPVTSGRGPHAGDAKPRAREGPPAAAGASLGRRDAAHDPASADRESPRPARRPRSHSTIGVDPLEVPLDAHHARVAVGALIDGLEVGKIGRLR